MAGGRRPILTAAVAVAVAAVRGAAPPPTTGAPVGRRRATTSRRRRGGADGAVCLDGPARSFPNVAKRAFAIDGTPGEGPQPQVALPDPLARTRGGGGEEEEGDSSRRWDDDFESEPTSNSLVNRIGATKREGGDVVGNEINTHVYDRLDDNHERRTGGERGHGGERPEPRHRHRRGTEKIASAFVPRARDDARAAAEERRRLLSDLALTMHDSHVTAVRSLLLGNAARVPPAVFGQSIDAERSACDERFRVVPEEEGRAGEGWAGGANPSDSAGEDKPDDAADHLSPRPPGRPSFRHIEDPSLLSYWGLTPDARLYGGAQYHRALRYYHHLLLTAPLPPATDDEVALLTDGIADVHDASDLLRAVAVLVRNKMEAVVEDVLDDMTRRLLYVMDRQWEMAEYSTTVHRPLGGSGAGGGSGDGAVAREAELLRGLGGEEYAAAEADVRDVLRAGYRRFVRERAAEARDRSLEDARSLLRYVSWDMGRAHGRARRDRGGERRGFVSHVEIVSRDESDGDNDSLTQLGQSDGRIDHGSRGRTKDVSKKKKKEKKKKKDAKGRISSRSSNRTVEMEGADVSGRWRRKRAGKGGAELNKSHGQRHLMTKGGDMSSHEEDEMGNLIAGVTSRWKPDDGLWSGDGDPSSSITTADAASSSKTSPMFIGDDEVLNVLLDTMSSTLASRFETQAHTRAAIEGLVSYVTDRTRMDLSSIVREKFNAFFLLAFYEDLGPYLRRELNEYLAAQCLEGDVI